MYTFLKSFKIFDVYHPKINYTYNWDASNYFLIDYILWLNPSKNIYDKNNLEAQKNSQIFLIDHQS